MQKIKRSFTFSIILLLALVSTGNHSIYSFSGDFCKTSVDQVNQSDCCCSPTATSENNCCDDSKKTSKTPGSDYQYSQHNNVCNCHIAPVSSVPVNPTESTITVVQKPHFKKTIPVTKTDLQRFHNQAIKKLTLFTSSISTSFSTLYVGNVCLRI